MYINSSNLFHAYLGFWLHRGLGLGSMMVFQIALQGPQGIKGLLVIRVCFQGKLVTPSSTSVVVLCPQNVGKKELSGRLEEKCQHKKCDSLKQLVFYAVKQQQFK